MTEAEQSLWCRIVADEMKRQLDRSNGTVDMNFVGQIADEAIAMLRKRMKRGIHE